MFMKNSLPQNTRLHVCMRCLYLLRERRLWNAAIVNPYATDQYAWRAFATINTYPSPNSSTPLRAASSPNGPPLREKLFEDNEKWSCENSYHGEKCGGDATTTFSYFLKCEAEAQGFGLCSGCCFRILGLGDEWARGWDCVCVCSLVCEQIVAD